MFICLSANVLINFPNSFKFVLQKGEPLLWYYLTKQTIHVPPCYCGNVLEHRSKSDCRANLLNTNEMEFERPFTPIECRAIIPRCSLRCEVPVDHIEQTSNVKKPDHFCVAVSSDCPIRETTNRQEKLSNRYEYRVGREWCLTKTSRTSAWIATTGLSVRSWSGPPVGAYTSSTPKLRT